MSEHDCRFEADIAVLKNDMTTVKNSVEGVGEITQKIYTVLTGNGGDGLVTKVSKHEDTIGDLKDAHTWWRRLIISCTVGGVLTGAIGFCWWSLRG